MSSTCSKFKELSYDLSRNFCVGNFQEGNFTKSIATCGGIFVKMLCISYKSRNLPNELNLSIVVS